MTNTSVTLHPGDSAEITLPDGTTISYSVAPDATVTSGGTTSTTPISSGSGVVSGGTVFSAVSSGSTTSVSTVSSGGTATPTPPPASDAGTIVNGTSGSISDGTNVYAINAGQQITINGVVVPSSAAVIQLYWDGTTVYQLNASGAWWTQPASGSAGTQVSGTPPNYPVKASTSTTPSGSAVATVPGKTPIDANTVIPVGLIGNLGTSALWKPSTAGAQVFRLSGEQGDWANLIKTLSPEGQAGGLCSKIPCPNGHLDWEYGNPEAEYYLDPSEVTAAIPSPFSIDASGHMVITCKQNTTPNSNQSWLSGALTTAGNQGVFFARDYGYFTAKMKFSGFGPGFWPAGWLLSDDAGGGNPDFNYCRETDAEWWQNLQSVHFGEANDNDGGVLVPMNPNSEFTIGFDVRPDFITWYLNGVQGHQIATNYPGVHSFFIFNIAVGTNGSWAGKPPAVAGSSMTMTIEEAAVFA